MDAGGRRTRRRGSTLSDRLRVGLMFGGRSVEHEVSVVSARGVAGAMRETDLECVPIGVTGDGRWLSPEHSARILEGDMPIYVEAGSAISSLLFNKLNPPRLFRQYEGQPGEPGALQFNVDMSDRYYPRSGDFHEDLLTAEEYYLLIMAADMNGAAYSRYNNPQYQ